jgi:hypothetical protein
MDTVQDNASSVRPAHIQTPTRITFASHVLLGKLQQIMEPSFVTTVQMAGMQVRTRPHVFPLVLVLTPTHPHKG